MKRLIVAAMLVLAPSFAFAQTDTPSNDFNPAGATAFVHQIFSAWSGSDPSALNDDYADSVDFYGSVVPASKVESANDRFTQRWQTRSYTISSIDEAQCDQATSVCVVSGVVHWDDLAPGPQLHSVGDANFRYSLKYDNGQYRIAGEDGNVLARTITKESAADADAVHQVPQSSDANAPQTIAPSTSDQTQSDTTATTPPVSDDGTQIVSDQPPPASSGGVNGILAAIGGAIVLWVIGGLFLYFLPTFVASWRGSTNGTLVFFLNLLLGWTFLGWIVAMIIAALSQTKDARKIERETLRRI
jgi:Superinfection immunity protein